MIASLLVDELLTEGYESIQSGIVALLESARTAVARNVNALMTATYWEIGRRIVEFEQGGAERAAYGQQLLKRLSSDLSAHFGRGFGVSNLQQMRLFFLLWPARIQQTVSVESGGGGGNRQTVSDNLTAIERQLNFQRWREAFPLPWSAYVRLLNVKSESVRDFYETEAEHGGWSVR